MEVSCRIKAERSLAFGTGAVLGNVHPFFGHAVGLCAAAVPYGLNLLRPYVQPSLNGCVGTAAGRWSRCSQQRTHHRRTPSRELGRELVRESPIVGLFVPQSSQYRSLPTRLPR